MFFFVMRLCCFDVFVMNLKRNGKSRAIIIANGKIKCKPTTSIRIRLLVYTNQATGAIICLQSITEWCRKVILTVISLINLNKFITNQFDESKKNTRKEQMENS